jgi:hypothetical protein
MKGIAFFVEVAITLIGQEFKNAITEKIRPQVFISGLLIERVIVFLS